MFRCSSPDRCERRLIGLMIDLLCRNLMSIATIEVINKSLELGDVPRLVTIRYEEGTVANSVEVVHVSEVARAS